LWNQRGVAEYYIVRNDEVVGVIPTSFTISQQLTGTDFAVLFQNVPIQFTIFGYLPCLQHGHHCALLHFRCALRVDFHVSLEARSMSSSPADDSYALASGRRPHRQMVFLTPPCFHQSWIYL